MMVNALDGGVLGVVRSRTHDGAEEDGAGDLVSDMMGDGEFEMLLRIADADVEVYSDNWKHNAHDVKSWRSTSCRVHPIATTSTFTSTRSRLHYRSHLLFSPTLSNIQSNIIL